MQFLGVDLGDKRTGVAAGDTVSGIVSPVEVIEVAVDAAGGEELLRRVAKAVGEYRPAAIVVGLPLNMDGSEGPAAKKVRAFGERLAAHTRTRVEFQDERLTSADADWAMSQSGLTHKQKKKRRDALAACAILRDYLLARGRSPSASSSGDADPAEPAPPAPGDPRTSENA
ncbi:MAG: Holliday junction resolvase RuvX [Planctomycetes bacterium]|nr:Holliday junction resolvase RuvX [Planctomycetota bacterium]